MQRFALTLALLVTIIASVPFHCLAAEEPPVEIDTEWTPIPFRVRDLTFPTVLVMGFMPRPNETLDSGQWVFEFNYSVSNNFQVSDDVQHYLEARGGARRPLDQSDIETMLRELEGDQYFFDGEFNLFDVGVHYGLTDRWAAALRVSYLSYGGGFLDSTIYNFHDSVGIGQAGRNFVSPDHFQFFFMGGDDDQLVHLERPTSGGFTDPVLSLSYTFPSEWRGWSFGLEGGLKIPLADEGVLLSSGGFDFGLQATAGKKWTKNAVVLNLAYVVPGDFDTGDGTFNPPNLPSLNVTYLRRLGRRTTGIAQFFFSEHILGDITDSELSELEFQMVIGAKVEAMGGIVGFGLTENLFNFDNTPDFGVHLSFAVAL